jgi:hypothetical protein
MLIHYLSKYLDFGDTLFMTLKQNNHQLTFLHLFHHTSILIVWGYLLQVGHANGTAYFGAAINSFVHTVMYSHYLWTSMGWVNPFKVIKTMQHQNNDIIANTIIVTFALTNNNNNNNPAICDATSDDAILSVSLACCSGVAMGNSVAVLFGVVAVVLPHHHGVVVC